MAILPMAFLPMAFLPHTVWACLGVNPLEMPRTTYRVSEENTLNNPPCPITLTSSSVHHLSHQLTTFLIYYNVTLNDHLCRKMT